MFDFVGSNKIGKNAVIEESFICPEYLEMGDNSYIGQHSIVSSNLVEGLYGALTVKKVKIGKKSVFGAFTIAAPGVELGDNSQYLPMSGSTKFTKLRSDRNYWGLPATRISRKRYAKFIQLPDELKTKIMKDKESKKKVEI
jgi:UDP-3-O-[3-hydroxymyristoyl] glucosamine N-acyltransferase